MRAVDCQGLGGAFTLGTVKAGFEIVGKVELPGGFGAENVERNHKLLGTFPIQIGPEEEWETYRDIPYMFGNPPCSGFSLMNTSASQARKAGKEVPENARGANSAINNCMKHLIAYAGRTRGGDGHYGPEIVAFESVQGAGKRDGRELMRWLRADLEQRTKRRYDLTLVFMSGAAVGAAQMRKRFFFVAHRVPFGVDVPNPPLTAATYADAIADLRRLKVQWGPQATKYEPSDWATRWKLPRKDGMIDAHMTLMPKNDGTNLDRAVDLFPFWKPGECFEECAKRHFRETGVMPGKQWGDIDVAKYRFGFNQSVRVQWDKAGYVITGAGATTFVHPEEDRFLTVRELARLQGFPDAWDWGESRKAGSWIGKGVPVQSGLWLSQWARRSLDGKPGPIVGQPIPSKEVGLGEREYVIDVTNHFVKP